MLSRTLIAARAVARSGAFARTQFRCLSAGFLDKAEVAERVQNVVRTFDKVDASLVTPTAHFTNDLGLDSLDTVEVVMAIEEEFVVDISDEQAEKLLSIDDAVEFLAAHPQAK